MRSFGIVSDYGLMRHSVGQSADISGKDSIVGNEMQILKRLGFNMQVSMALCGR